MDDELDISVYIDDPVAFAEDILGFTPDDWQREVMMEIVTNPQISVKSGQGVGKTSVESAIIIWYLCCRINAKIVCTAPTLQQLNDVLWAEVAKWLNNSLVKDVLRWTKTKIYMIGEEQRWFATARTANKPENMQGFHEDNLLFIIDEASGIADDVVEAILGTLSGVNNRVLMCGNPTQTSGIFFDSFHKDRADWTVHTVNSAESQRTNKNNIKRLIHRYGENSDVVRVRVYGEFPKGEPNAWISLESVEQAVNREKPPIGDDYDIKLGVDVARFGDDETVIATRIGNVIRPLQSWQGQDLMKTVDQIVRQCERLNDQYHRTVTVVIDDTGVGGGVTDRLREVVQERMLSVRVLPVNYAQKGNKEYAGITSVMYGNFKEIWLDDIVLPQDDDLIAQLSIRRYAVDSAGRILLETKKNMKSRGFHSPDRADAVVMATYEPPETKVHLFEGGV